MNTVLRTTDNAVIYGLHIDEVKANEYQQHLNIEDTQWSYYLKHVLLVWMNPDIHTKTLPHAFKGVFFRLV